MFSIESLTSEGFSFKAALSLALSSQLAYDDAARVESVATGDWGLAEARFFDVDDTQAFVARNSDIVVLAFRGTENLGDWLTNLGVFSTSEPYGAVHAGFHKAFAVVRDRITDYLGPGDLGGRKLWLTGHSLGGALAAIAAAEFQGSYPVTGLHTFGQPRVGFSEFRAFMNSHYGGRFFRFVNDDDIVPRVPPLYQHVGTLIHFDASGDLQAAPGALEAGPGALEAVAAADTEPRALTETEFQDLKDQIRELETAAKTLEAGESLEAARGLSPAEPAVAERALFQGVRDHSLARYIAAIRRHTDNPF